jgi:hypothetical protein
MTTAPGIYMDHRYTSDIAPPHVRRVHAAQSAISTADLQLDQLAPETLNALLNDEAVGDDLKAAIRQIQGASDAGGIAASHRSNKSGLVSNAERRAARFAELHPSSRINPQSHFSRSPNQ